MKISNSLLVFIGLVYANLITGQNVGIGTTTPLSRLHVISDNPNTIRIDGPNGMFISLYEAGVYRGYMGSYGANAEDVDFGTGSTNTTGKLHLTIKASPRLTIGSNGYVGINNVSPAWPLDVNGSMQLNGRLVVNGTSGSAGQVLMSQALAPPSWETLSSPFSNDVRFSFSGSNNTVLDGDLSITTRYNTNPSIVTVSGTNIIFSKTGIYHFDIAISGRLDYGSALGYDPGFSVNFYVHGGVGGGNNTVAATVLRKSGTLNRYFGIAIQGFDMYLTAGQYLNAGFSYANATTGYTILDTFGSIRGYLISE